MTGEDLKTLYMDIYDNGISDYDYKEKFKRYINNRFESLEKENAELKEGNKELQRLVQQREQRGLEVQEDLLKEKEELEKENAELKKSIKYATTICERKSVTNSQLTELAADSSAKLCEAKKIIKDLLEEEKNNMYWEMNGSDKSSYYKVKKEAEQFLSEVKE